MKKEIRKSILNIRKSLEIPVFQEKSDSVTEKLINSEAYKKSNVIMAYIDFRNEVSTEKFIKKALKDNKKVIIPISIVETKELLLSELKDYDTELKSGTYGILEPKEDFIREVKKDIIDLILVPGVAFDLRGYRVGYGAGYYDRFLKNISPTVPKIALAFDLQIVENAYPDSHDFPVDYIITETIYEKCQK